MTGDRIAKPWFVGFGELIGISIGLAAIAWVLDSILDSVIFHEGTLFGQLLSPTVHEIGVRVLFGFVIIVFGIYVQLNMERRKRAEEELWQSEKKHRMLVENIQDGVFIIQDSKFQYVNEAFARTAGYNVGEIIGRDFREFVAPDDLEMVADRYHRRLAGENVPSEYEFHMMRKDGARIIVNMNAGLVSYRGMVASMGILKDITERKRAEKALQEAVVKIEEERNKSNAVIAALADGIIIQDTDYKIVYQNQIQDDLFGNRIGEYCYKAYEGRDTICEWCPVELTFRDGKIHKTEREMNTESGTMYYELISSPLSDSTGKIIAGVKVVRDITELKRNEKALRESEERYRSLFDNANDAIYLINPRTEEIIDCNKKAVEMDGYSIEELKNMKAADLHPPDERKTLAEKFKDVFSKGQVAGISGFHHMRKDGELIPVEVNATIIEIGGEKLNISNVRDITKRTRVEKEKDRLLKAIENSTEGITIADEKDRYIYVNAAYAKIFGYTQEEFIGKTWRKITPLELIAPTEKGLSSTMHNSDIGVFNGEVPGLRKDGTEIPTEVRGTALWGENGNYLGHICIVRDITERKKVEEKIMLLSEAMEEAPDGIIIADLKGFIIYSNRAIQNIYDFSPDELNGKHVSELNVEPEFTRKVMLPDIRTKGRWVGELTVKKKTGIKFPIWLTASLVKDSKGEPIALVGVIRDITERKHIERVLQESEERYRSLFEDSPISLWEEDSSEIKKYIDALKSKEIEDLRTYFDRHPKEVALFASMLKVVDVNKATINLFKAKSKDDIINGLENIFTERSNETFKEELIAIADGKTSFYSEDILKTLTGDRINVSIRWVLTPGSEKTYSKRLVSIIDITERKQAEEKIRNYTRELEESNHMKELFTDIMHHDLLNPLNTAKGFIELLKENETKSNKRAYLETIERSLGKGMELIDGAMKFSRFESLKSIELEELDLKGIIEEVVETLIPLADNAGVEIVNRMTFNAPVRANKIIEEVFSNIIANAIKYASGGKRIIVESKDKGESQQVRVIDFGEGIKETERTVIFERFRRGGKIGVKGSGLGLAIAGKIMELHNGRIWVEDNPEGGAVFIVEIPKSLS
ncbi:Methyl sulfide methyltransferase-associated sensor [uncultured archaeon]|nr:Methyl sulfide methyltransferase-associated sensor [uncultured archaeon]